MPQCTMVPSSGAVVALFTNAFAMSSAYRSALCAMRALPTRLFAFSVNHMLPSTPSVMPVGALYIVGTGTSVITPAVLTTARRLRDVFDSVTQRVPSLPATMLCGPELTDGSANSVMTPAGVIRPTLSIVGEVFVSVNHRLPSGPAVMPRGLPTVGTVYSVIVPFGVILAILWAKLFDSVNHRLPSGPGAMASG